MSQENAVASIMAIIASGRPFTDGLQTAICETGETYEQFRVSVDLPKCVQDIAFDDALGVLLALVVGRSFGAGGRIYWRKHPTFETAIMPDARRIRYLRCRLIITNEEERADLVT